MDSSALEEAWNYFREFTGVFYRSAQRTKQTETFVKELDSLLGTFSMNLQQLMDRYSDGFFETDKGRTLGGCLSKIAASYKSLSMQIKNEIVEPFAMFSDNFRATIETVAKKASDMLSDLERQRTSLSKFQQQYYQSYTKMLRSKQEIERAIQKIEKGGKNNDLMKANDLSMKLRIVVEQHQRQYKDSVDKVNGVWKKTLKELNTLFSMVDYNEESRLAFTKNTTNAILRLIVQEWPTPDRIQIEQTLQRRQSQSTKKTVVNTKLEKFTTLEKKESFISYEDSKLRSIKKSESKSDNDVTEADLDEISQLLDIWVGESQGKTLENLERVRMTILQNSAHSQLFVESLHRRIQLMPGYYYRLDEDHFNELLNVLSLISRSTTSNDAERLWKIINVSMRLMKKKKDKNSTSPRDLVVNFLGRQRTFQDEKNWLAIWQYIKDRDNNKPIQTQSLGIGSFLVQGLKGLGDFVTNKKTPKQQNSLKNIQEVATLMSSLCLPSDFSLPLVKRMLESVGESKSLELLRDHLYNKHDIQLRQKLTNFKDRAISKQQKCMDLVGSRRAAAYVLNMVAKKGFLGVADINLRLVCKRLKNIHRVIIHQLDIPHKYVRLMDASKKNYIQMKTEVAENSCPSAIEEIISLDVNRSLHIHSALLPPTLLHTLLRTFAYYNKEIGYCQGMNYLAGYIFIKVKNQEQAYLVFDKAMHELFWQIFVNEFETLKLKMYQFDRLLNIFLPELADHFKRQMVSPECYMVSWVIAMFSSAYQYTKQSWIVDLLWLRFMVWGWKEFFKFTLWVLAKLKDDLMELGFDRILHTLSDLLKSELFMAGDGLTQRAFAEQLDKYHVTNSLLERLKKEYLMSVET